MNGNIVSWLTFMDAESEPVKEDGGKDDGWTSKEEDKKVIQS